MSAHLRNSPDDDRHSCYRKRLSSGCSPDYESFTGQPRPASHRCRLAEIVHDGHEGLVGIAGTVVKEAHHRRPGFALDLFEGGVARKRHSSRKAACAASPARKAWRTAAASTFRGSPTTRQAEATRSSYGLLQSITGAGRREAKFRPSMDCETPGWAWT